jgi:hypothetical protein
MSMIIRPKSSDKTEKRRARKAKRRRERESALQRNASDRMKNIERSLRGHYERKSGMPGHHALIGEVLALICSIYAIEHAPTAENMEEIYKGMVARPFNATRIASRKSEAAAVSEKDLREFYKSWPWKEVRYAVLKTHGRRCQCCGAEPHQKRIVVDHIKPLRKRWDLRLDQGNLQVLCDDCNMGKSYKDETDWRSTPEPEVPDVSISEEYSAFHLGGRFH